MNLSQTGLMPLVADDRHNERLNRAARARRAGTAVMSGPAVEARFAEPVRPSLRAVLARAADGFRAARRPATSC
jgi:hypothetical protein